MTRVILYIRVSTDNQAERGYSLNHQLQTLQTHCSKNRYEILRVFQEDYSAKDGFDRPEWKNLLSFIRNNKGGVEKIVFTTWDRFSRNQVESRKQIDILRKLGVAVESLENNFNLQTPESLLLENIFLTLPQIEIERLSRRTRAGMLTARQQGCFMGKAPRGYRNTRIGKNSTLEYSNESTIIKEVFVRMASGNYTTEETRMWLLRKGIRVSKNAFLNLIRNRVYVGEIEIKEGKKIVEIVQGLHPPIIEKGVFLLANELLNGRKRNMVFHTEKFDVYPLKGILVCPIHGRTLTGSKSKGNGGEYHYYQCTAVGCTNKRIPVKEAEEQIESILSKISFNAGTIKKYKNILTGYFSSEKKHSEGEIKKLRRDLEKLEDSKELIRKDYLSNKLSPSSYSELKEDIELEREKIKNTLSELEKIVNPVDEYLMENVPILANILKFYQNSPGRIKNRLLGCIFSEKVEFLNGKNTTIPLHPAISVLSAFKGVFDGSKTKKEVLDDPFFNLAPPAGLEPATL
jgi:site-specific DNA recombinase